VREGGGDVSIPDQLTIGYTAECLILITPEDTGITQSLFPCIIEEFDIVQDLNSEYADRFSRYRCECGFTERIPLFRDKPETGGFEYEIQVAASAGKQVTAPIPKGTFQIQAELSGGQCTLSSKAVLTAVSQFNGQNRREAIPKLRTETPTGECGAIHEIKIDKT